MKKPIDLKRKAYAGGGDESNGDWRLFALPAGILSAGFVEEIRSKKEHGKKCPHCGAKLD